MNLDGDAAKRAFEPLAQRFGLSVEQAASSALQLADANIVRAIQLVSTERGRDPRDYALVPFGGAGPLHAARIAEELGISTIVVPPNAGVISAYGLVASDYTKFDAVTRKMKLDDAAAKEAGRIFGEMRARLAAQFADMKLPGDLVYTHTLDMRFVGQAFEVGVEVPANRLGSLDCGLSRRAVRRRPSPHLHARRHARPAGRDRDPAGRRHPADRHGAEARSRDAGGARAGEGQDLPRRGLDRLRALHGRDARRPARRSRAPPSSKAIRPRPGCRPAGQPSWTRPTISSCGEHHDRAQSHRLCRDQPGADRLGARDGREADPLGLLDHPARGARRLGRPDGPPRQHGGAGRAHSHAAGPDRRDAARLPQAPSGRDAQGRRLPDQQRPVRGRPAHPRRLHLHADLRRRPRRRLRRLGGASPRSRRRRARPQHPRLRRLPGRPALPAQQVRLPARLERRLVRAAGDGQCARARPHHRRLQCAVRRQRDRRAAGEAALRALWRRQGRSGDDGDAGLLRAPRARRHRPGAQGHVLRRGCGRRRWPHRRSAGGEGQGHDRRGFGRDRLRGHLRAGQAQPQLPLLQHACRRRSPA